MEESGSQGSFKSCDSVSLENLLSNTNLFSNTNGSSMSMEVEDVSCLPRVQTYENIHNDYNIIQSPQQQNELYPTAPEQDINYGDNIANGLMDLSTLLDFSSLSNYDAPLQGQFFNGMNTAPFLNFEPNIAPNVQYYEAQQPFVYQQENIRPVYPNMYQQENIQPHTTLPTYNACFGYNTKNTYGQYMPQTSALPSQVLANKVRTLHVQTEPTFQENKSDGSTSNTLNEMMLHDESGHYFNVKIQARVLQEAHSNQDSQKQYMLIPITGNLPDDIEGVKFIDLKSETIQKINNLSRGNSVLLPVGVEDTLNYDIKLTRRSPPLQMYGNAALSESSGVSSINSSPTRAQECQDVLPTTEGDKNITATGSKQNEEPINVPNVPYCKKVRKRKQRFECRLESFNSDGFTNIDEETMSRDDLNSSQQSKRSKTTISLKKSISNELIEIGQNLTSAAVICSQESVSESLPEPTRSVQKTKSPVKPKKMKTKTVAKNLSKEFKKGKNSEDKKPKLKKKAVTVQLSIDAVFSPDSKVATTKTKKQDTKNDQNFISFLEDDTVKVKSPRKKNMVKRSLNTIKENFNHQCNDCNKKCRSADLLKAHKMTHTNGSSSKTSKPKKTKQVNEVNI